MAKGRKMKGASRRVPVNFTIEEDLLKVFNKYCDDNCINKSAFIEQQIKKVLNNSKK